jgi:hypothetical protein
MGNPKADHRLTFKDVAQEYLDRGYSIIPEKYMKKTPCIKGWTDFAHRQPTQGELGSWKDIYGDQGMSVMTGKISGIVALDIDETRQEVLDILMPLLPPSPVVKVGAKGETRFFKFVGESSDILKLGGKVVMEILSTNKKTTIPPSIHPNGTEYKYVSENTLLDIDRNSLPILPPALFSHVGSKLRLAFPDLAESSSNKFISGRNDALSSLCGKLIQESTPLDEALKRLIAFDRENNDPPLFSDPEEMRHTEPFSNALLFYTNHLNSVNTKRYRDNKFYEVPMTASAINAELKQKAKDVKEGKSQRQELTKNSKTSELLPAQIAEKITPSLPTPKGVMKNIYDNILACSWVKQPNLAFSAALSLMSTVVSRKVIFGGMSPNLYVLNISPSGSGKDAPQQKLKEILIDMNADSLMGSGDYVSDASLMDSLPTSPVRLDIMDEAGGILRTVNSGKGEYNGKMADVLAELWSCGNSYYMGRALAEGTKGSCYRPNVNLLASTTPTGFTEGISIQAIEKGLLGRFLIFLGDGDTEARRLKALPHLDVNSIQRLQWWYKFEAPESTAVTIRGIKQKVLTLEATQKAHSRLDEIFIEFDNRRRVSDSDNPLLPIIARMYQQLTKITILHACSRSEFEIPVIDVEDVDFAHATVLHYFANMETIVEKYVFGSNYEKNVVNILNKIRSFGEEGITRTDLYKKTRSIGKRDRDNIIQELIDTEQVILDTKVVDGISKQVMRIA